MLLFLLGSCSDYEGQPLQGYVEGEYTLMASTVSGKLFKLHVERGQSVKADQRLFDLDPEPESSAFKKAKSNLDAEKSKLRDYMSGERSTVLGGIIAQREQAQADLELAKSNFSRTEQLYQKAVVSKSDYDDALAKLKSTQQKVTQFEENLKEAELGERQYRILEQAEQVRAAEATLQEAKWRLEQKTITAPEASLVFDTLFNEGEQVAANQAVVSLLAPRYIRLIFYVPEPIRSKLALNARVEFDCDGCNQRFTAYINYISPEAEYTPPVIFSRESRIKLVYRVQAKLPLGVAAKVTPGQPVDVYIPLQTHKRKYFFGINLWQLMKK